MNTYFNILYPVGMVIAWFMITRWLLQKCLEIHGWIDGFDWLVMIPAALLAMLWPGILIVFLFRRLGGPAAANRLFIGTPKPNLQHRIKELEKELGIRDTESVTTSDGYPKF